MNRFIIIFVACFAGVQLFGQQDAKFTHYKDNSLYFNPGMAGIEGRSIYSSLYRSQWLGWVSSYDPGKSPKTFLASANIPILAVKGGAGIMVISDRLGPMQNLSVQLSGSKHIKVGSGNLGLGLQFNYNSIQFVYSWRPPDGVETIDSDNSIPKGNSLSQGLVDIAGGAWYQTSDYYVGLSSTRILNQEYESTQSTEGGQRRHYYLTGGYNIEVTPEFVVTPTMLVKSTFSDKGTQFDVGALAVYDETYRGGLNFRQGEAISLLLGMNFLNDKSLTLSYALDFVVVNNSAKALTSHEIMIVKRMPMAKLNTKPPIMTPRFRY